MPRQPHRAELRQRHLEVLPAARVVAGPQAGPSLDAGIPSAREYERPLLRPQPAGGLCGGPHLEQAVHVVSLAVSNSLVGSAVHGLVRRIDTLRIGILDVAVAHRRLVHVLDEPVYPGVCQPTMLFAPPCAYLGIEEVRERAEARPNVS
jgi:hypothetical protein